MRKKWLWGTLGVAFVAGGIAYVKRDAIAMNLIQRGADAAMTRNVMADLPKDQLFPTATVLLRAL
jgi:ribonuclease Z